MAYLILNQDYPSPESDGILTKVEVMVEVAARHLGLIGIIMVY